jgi:hypothetical protein
MAKATIQNGESGAVIRGKLNVMFAELYAGTGVSFGTGVADALAHNVGSSGALVVYGGALGTPASGTLTNCTGLPAGGVSGLAASATTDATNATNIASGTLPAARLPAPTASTLGGTESAIAASHNFMTGINTSGVPQFAQPAAADVSGLAASATTDATNATNIASGILAAARGGAGDINGLMKANGSGAVSAASAGTDYVAPGTTANLTAGITVTEHGFGTLTSGTFTPDPTLGNEQYGTFNGVTTLAPPSASCCIRIEISNGASASSLTTSGFTKVGGDPYVTTSGSKFYFFMNKSTNYSSVIIEALQ